MLYSSYHQRCFFLRQTVALAESFSQILHEERVLGTHRSKWDVYIKSLLSDYREPWGRRVIKNVRARGDGIHTDSTKQGSQKQMKQVQGLLDLCQVL